MTRTGFLEGEYIYGDLLEICRDYELSTLDGVCNSEEYCYVVQDDLKYKVEDGENWEDVSNWLYNLPVVCDGNYYRKDEYGDWEVLEFDDLVNNIAEDMDYLGYFESEEEECAYEEQSEPESTEDETPEVTEDELMSLLSAA